MQKVRKMRKNIYILCFVSSLLLISCGKKTIIQGVITGADSSKLVLENFNAGKPLQLGEEVLDKNGKFQFKVSALDTTEIYNLLLDSSKIIRLVVKPEEHVAVATSKEGFGTAYEVTGSPESDLFRQAELKLWETRQELAALKKQYATATTKEAKQQLEEAYQNKFAKHHDYLRHFVFDNASSLAAYLALYQKVDAQNYVFGDLNDDKYVRAVAQKMKNEHPNSPYFGLLLKELEQRTVQKRNAKVLEMIKQAENSYPELSLKNAKGETVVLSETKAKYALLYFGLLNDATKAQLLPIYQKYHKRGLQIYFVDENPNPQIWRQAVKDLNTPWLNVYDDKKMAAAIYNVQKVPANYIIELKGTIEGKDLFGLYLTEKLDKILR